jgi:hypothetical protein
MMSSPMRWVLLVLLIACAKSPRTRCEVACRAETDCAEKLELTDNDYSECAQSCAALEGDTRARNLVETHLACVANAGSCEEILACGQRYPGPGRAHKPRSPIDLERTAAGLRARARRDVDLSVDGAGARRLGRGDEIDLPRGATRLVLHTADTTVTVRLDATPAAPRPQPVIRRIVVGPFGAAAEVDP